MCLQPGCFQVRSCSASSDLCSVVPRIPNAKCTTDEDSSGASCTHHHKMLEGNRYVSYSLNSLIQILYSLYSLTPLTWNDLFVYNTSVTNGTICPEGYVLFMAKHLTRYLWDRTSPVWIRTDMAHCWSTFPWNIILLCYLNQEHWEKIRITLAKAVTC